MDLIGDSRQVVTLCLNAATSQGAGGTDNYGALVTTRGKLAKSSGNRGLLSGEIEGNSSYTLTVRYQQAIAFNTSISAKWLIDNVFYTITSWDKVGERDFYYKFQLNKKEPVAAGSIDLSAITSLGIQEPLYLTGTAGESSVTSGLLQQGNASIMLVARSGTIYRQVANNPGNLEFSFENGEINFSTGNLFNSGGENVYVLYKLTA